MVFFTNYSVLSITMTLPLPHRWKSSGHYATIRISSNPVLCLVSHLPHGISSLFVFGGIPIVCGFLADNFVLLWLNVLDSLLHHFAQLLHRLIHLLCLCHCCNHLSVPSQLAVHTVITAGIAIKVKGPCALLYPPPQGYPLSRTKEVAMTMTVGQS